MNTSGLGRLATYLSLATVLLVAAFVHMAYVKAFGVDVPTWDQWRAEGFLILKPWAEGRLSWHALFVPWNEHRIAVTRIITILVYEASGESWAVLRTLYANAWIYALIPATMAWFIGRSDATRPLKVLMGFALVVVAALPYGWENTLGAFQNQFYVMILAAVWATGIAAMYRPSPAVFASLIAVTTASLITMAPGLVAGPAAAAVLIARAWTGSVKYREVLPCAAILVGLAVAGYASTPVVAAHAGLHPTSLHDGLHALAIVAGWPSESPRTGVVLIWAPTVIGTVMMFRRRWVGSGDAMMLGLSFWTTIQIAGIVVSRGNDLAAVTSRYTDVLVIGVLSNLWFALRILVTPSRRPAHVAGAMISVLMLLVVARGLVVSTTANFDEMVQARDIRLMQQAHVDRYLLRNDPRELAQPAILVGSPDATEFKAVLDDPTLRRMLQATQGPGKRANSTPAGLPSAR